MSKSKGSGSGGAAPNVTSLFAAAKDDGLISPASMRALAIPDLGAQIQAGLGVSVDDVKASEVVLVTVMPDDSGSIRFVSGNTEAVRDGHNGVISALAGSKQKDSIYFHTRYLNGTVLYPYGPLDRAVKMDPSNYDPNLGTPLYDQTVVLLGTVLAKTTEFEQAGVPVRTVTLIITDGHDEGSRRATPGTVATIVRDLLKSERHIIAAMGIDDGGTTDFRRVFTEMGLEDQWILTPGNSPAEIRKAFAVFSQSAVRASQNAGSFSKAALAGFGTP